MSDKNISSIFCVHLLQSRVIYVAVFIAVVKRRLVRWIKRRVSAKAIENRSPERGQSEKSIAMLAIASCSALF